jgi:hypothetical protein
MKLVGVGKVEILRESLRECSSSSYRGLELSELCVYDVFVLQTAQLNVVVKRCEMYCRPTDAGYYSVRSSMVNCHGRRRSSTSQLIQPLQD